MIVQNMNTCRGGLSRDNIIIQLDGLQQFKDADTEQLYLITRPLIFVSYNRIIAIKGRGGVLLNRSCWRWSPTTSRYRNKFLNEKTMDTEQKIKDGIYTLIDLEG